MLYNAAGTNVAATFYDRHAYDTLPLVVEHKCYRAAFASADEAHYTTAVLNASYLNLLIKPFQSAGLLGERDIEKKVLDAPIPLFDPADKLHQRLASLGVQCHLKAQAVVDTDGLTHARSLARSRKQMRDLLRDELEAIDTCVEELLR